MFASRRRRTSTVERLERREVLSASSLEIAARLGQHLSRLSDASFGAEQRSQLLSNLVADSDSVSVEAHGFGDVGKLKSDLANVGFLETLTYGDTIVGDLPFASISALEAMDNLSFVRAIFKPDTNAGTVLSQADLSMRSDEARSNTQLASLPANGAGVKIGIISNSYNNLGGASTDVSQKELPGTGYLDFPTPVQVLSDGPGSDEGRAMAQLIHDVAPGATLMFHKAGTAVATLAAAIDGLVTAGADIIVDDISMPNEPFF